MRPALELGRLPRPAADAHARRVERTRELVAAHPQWRGINHPERIFFPEPATEADALLAYHDVLRRAVRHLRESEALCERIDAVADSIGRVGGRGACRLQS